MDDPKEAALVRLLKAAYQIMNLSDGHPATEVMAIWNELDAACDHAQVALGYDV